MVDEQLSLQDLEHTIPFEMEPTWKEVLQQEWKKPYLWQLASFLAQEKAAGNTIYPPEHLVFNAFYQTPYERVKVVIIGQDPYHGPHQAHGLSFSVPLGVRFPPSLQNIFKELNQDLGIPIPKQGCLLPWAKQGVLLLNATLTVRESQPLAHHKKGWEQFTDAVVRALMLRPDPVIFVLWGKNAIEKCRIVLEKSPNHPVLTAAHPSPYSANNGFFGCRHFSKVNELLIKMGKEPIDWRLDRD